MSVTCGHDHTVNITNLQPGYINATSSHSLHWTEVGGAVREITREYVGQLINGRCEVRSGCMLTTSLCTQNPPSTPPHPHYQDSDRDQYICPACKQILQAEMWLKPTIASQVKQTGSIFGFVLNFPHYNPQECDATFCSESSSNSDKTNCKSMDTHDTQWM